VPNDSATLKLIGDRVPLAEFASAMGHFRALIDALTSEVTQGNEIEWIIEALEVGSAVATVRGEALTEQAAPDVERVVDAYGKLAQGYASGAPVPFSRLVTVEMSHITGLINGNVEAVQFETAEAEAIIRHLDIAAPAVPYEVVVPRVAFGAVEGRIQTVSSRHGLRFTLYDSLDDRAVSCYVTTEQAEQLREAWGRRAIVEGQVSRDPLTGRPIAVRQVTALTVLPDAKPGSYRDARGVVPLAGGGLLPEDAIRRVRDAWGA
jgi:hypothetical protein